MSDAIIIRRTDPTAPEAAALLARHLALMHATSPRESVHAMPADALAGPEIEFYALFDEGVLTGVGALKWMEPGLAELKSMHVAEAARGRGLARRMLAHLVGAARAGGARRLFLETGSQAAFAAARALYRSAGFTPCPPFGPYREDPNSIFLTLALD